MKSIVLLATLICAPVSAQGLGSLQHQPDLFEQQRQDMANGRYGKTHQQQLQEEALRNQADRRQQQRQPGQLPRHRPLTF